MHSPIGITSPFKLENTSYGRTSSIINTFAIAIKKMPARRRILSVFVISSQPQSDQGIKELNT